MDTTSVTAVSVAAVPDLHDSDLYESDQPEAAGLLRAGTDADAMTLRAMALDGLLIQLTQDCWAPAGAPVDARTRAAALGPPELPGTIYSHATAHWLWWGCARAPITLSVTTRTRRRMRGADSLHVYERSVAAADIANIAGVPLTTPAATLFDEAIAREREPNAAPPGNAKPDAEDTARFLAGLLADVGAGDIAGFRERVTRSGRRPGIAALRRGLRAYDALSR